jgi:hypothetical protein
LEAYAAWNSDVRGANDQKDPIASDPCRITSANHHWEFQLDLPAAARALPIFGDDATLRVTVTDRSARESALSPSAPTTADRHDVSPA